MFWMSFSALFVPPKPRLLRPEDFISSHNLLANTGVHMGTCIKTLRVLLSRRTSLTSVRAKRKTVLDKLKPTYGTWSCTAGREGSSSPSWFCSRAGWRTPRGCKQAQCQRCQSLGCGTWDKIRNRLSCNRQTAKKGINSSISLIYFKKCSTYYLCTIIIYPCIMTCSEN